jgi:hypothetical protein
VLVIQTDLSLFFPPSPYWGAKVNTCHCPTKPGNLLLFISLTTEEVNLSTKTYSFRDMAPVDQRTKAKTPAVGHALCHMFPIEPLKFPLKSRHFLSQRGQKSFERLTLPVLLLI